MPLRILKTSVDGITGHIQHEVRVEEEVAPGQISLGPVETIGIWPRALISRFHDSGITPCHESVCAAHLKWLKHQHSEMIQRKRHLDLMHSAAKQADQKLFRFEDEK